MRIRLERDVLAEAVAWTARSLPARPPVPVLAGLLVEASGDQLTLSSFDYEVSARIDDRCRPSRRPAPRAGLRPAAGRDHPEPAGPAGDARRPRAPRCCWSAAAPGSRCRRCRSRTTRRCRTCRRSPARCTAPPSPRPSPRSRSRPGATTRSGAHRDPARDRRRRRSRSPRPTVIGWRSASCRWEPGQSGRRGRRPGPGPDPRRHCEGAGGGVGGLAGAELRRDR